MSTVITDSQVRSIFSVNMIILVGQKILACSVHLIELVIGLKAALKELTESASTT